MSMLSSQVDELRELADATHRRSREIGSDYGMGRGLADASRMLFEAADTIKGLRDRLLKAERACDEKSYDAGFDNGMKAVLQQLDGLIHDGADVEEIQGWIDRQWEEES